MPHANVYDVEHNGGGLSDEFKAALVYFLEIMELSLSIPFPLSIPHSTHIAYAYAFYDMYGRLFRPSESAGILWKNNASLSDE